MRVLGIESSCDETAAAIVEDGTHLLSNVVASSADLHIQFGGVVPEIAARSHIEVVVPVVERTLSDAHLTWEDIDAIAVTYGPGLGGSLLIGVLTARTLALVFNKPLYAVDHVEGHAYANFIASAPTGYVLPASSPAFPILALIVSGGHSQLVLFKDHFTYDVLGQTVDDAIGEAFDKVAKILGLPYPGGPSIAKTATTGDPHRYELPKAKLQGKYDFSFSGLKTAVLRLAQSEVGADFSLPSLEVPGRLTAEQRTDIAAAFQRIAIETIVDKTVQAYEEFHPSSVVIAGGVAASTELRRQLAERLPSSVICPDSKLCGDNGAMIACLGCFQVMHGQPQADPLTLSIVPNLSM